MSMQEIAAKFGWSKDTIEAFTGSAVNQLGWASLNDFIYAAATEG